MMPRWILPLCAVCALTIASGIGVAGPLTDEIYAVRQNDSRTRLDVGHVATKHIPVGSDVAFARRILEGNGFKLYEIDKHDGSYNLVGTQLRRTLWRFLPFIDDEYKIILRIRDNKVESAWGRVILQAL